MQKTNASQHAEITLRTVLNMLEAGASIDDAVAFYRTAAECPCHEVENKSTVRYTTNELTERFRRDWPGAPAAAPVSVEPRVNTANLPLALVEQFQSAWPGAPGVTDDRDHAST